MREPGGPVNFCHSSSLFTCDFGLGRIKVESSIFSSTCLKKITFPRKFPDKDTFLAAIHAVCNSAGRAFTSILEVLDR